jgi:hypothetical protein
MIVVEVPHHVQDILPFHSDYCIIARFALHSPLPMSQICNEPSIRARRASTPKLNQMLSGVVIREFCLHSILHIRALQFLLGLSRGIAFLGWDRFGVAGSL